jgi:hypothetical protein
VVAGLVVTRMIRAIPGAGWIAQPVPGRGLLRRAIGLLVLLVLVSLVLDALTGDRGREERLSVFVVHPKRTPAIAAHIRAAQAAGKPAILHQVLPTPPNRRPGRLPRLARPGQLRRVPVRLHHRGRPGQGQHRRRPTVGAAAPGRRPGRLYRRHRIGNGDAFVVVVQ